jgi:anti-sigma B factor antagonist
MRHRYAVGADSDGHPGDGGPLEAQILPGAVRVVAVRGEIDIATKDQLWVLLEKAMDDRHRLVIDLSDTTFIGATGVTLLVQAWRQLGRRRGAVVLRSPQPQARKVFEITGIDRLFTITDGETDGPTKVAARPAPTVEN